MTSKKNNDEYNHFGTLSDEWWNENGKFRILHKIRPLRIQYILNQITKGKIKDLDILDIGCGGGLVSEPLSRLGANVTGIDFIENNIEVAKKHSVKKNLKINYIHGDIEKIKLDKKFDIIIMFEILEHLNDWRYFLNKAIHNLNKNGLIIISTINRNIFSNFSAIFIAENILRWVPKGTHTYEKLIKPQEIEDFMKMNNLKLKNLTGLIFDPFELNWRFSKNTKINYFCTYK